MSAAMKSSSGLSDVPRSPLDPAFIERLSSLVFSGEGRDQQQIFSPFDGSFVGEVPQCNAEDVLAAIARARRVQADWAAKPLKEKCAIFLKFHDMLLAQQERLLDLVQVETGKARVSALEEVLDTAGTARYYAHTAADHLKARHRRGALPIITETVEQYVAKGVVGIIAPWNYPLTLAVSDAVPALLAGNTVVLKPDSQTPFSALVVIDLLYKAGLPREVFTVVTGRGSVIGTPMIENVDYVMFTGSTKTGKTIAAQCASRLIGFSAELGGKNPMLVLADADIDRAVEGSVRACYSNSGQLCMSIERIYVEDAVHDEFVAKFAKRVNAMRLSNGLDWDAEMGCLINQDQIDTISRHVDDAIDKGATLLAGGKARPDLGPLFFEPTLLTDITEDMEMYRDETFGPVVAVYRVKDEAEAIKAANDTAYGLNASIWAKPAHAVKVASQIKAGTVNVNEGYAAGWASHDAPMGGMGESGVGRRHGREGIIKYCEAQTVAIQRVIPVGTIPGVPADTGAKLLSTGLKVLRHTPFYK
jgi:succinate-semialdehyde dehydrogenase/glutarate-semialdehyde dehydrogenase